MSRLDIIITMGGLGSRFREAGYILPKYMIEARGRTLFEWSLISLEGYRESADKYIFIALRDKNEDVKGFIDRQCHKLRIRNYHVILIDYLTDGQATTALLANKLWNKKNGLLIYNIDTYVEAGEMKEDELKGDGFIPCFYAEGDHWSFVKTDAENRAVEIREKKRISDNCTLGAYYFKTCDLFEKLYEEYYVEKENLVNGEKYIAPLYNLLLQLGGDVYISRVEPKKVHVLGTPEELEAFIEK